MRCTSEKLKKSLQERGSSVGPPGNRPIKDDQMSHHGRRIVNDFRSGSPSSDGTREIPC